METLDILYKIHQDLPREGPGDSASTRRAYSILKNLPAKPLILEVGCGPGKQTLDLADSTKGFIVALDNHQPYLSVLKDEASRLKLSHRIGYIKADMSLLPFRREAFDVIWAEGSIFIIGFRRGLEAWWHYLKPGGSLAVSELTWFKSNPPEELIKFWKVCDVEVSSPRGNFAIAKRFGFDIIGYFALPRSAWWDEYYQPLEERLKLVRETYIDNREILEMIDLEQTEIELYRKYSDYYGYLFYVMQKRRKLFKDSHLIPDT